MSDTADYVSVESAGKLLGVSARTVRNWINDGKLPAVSGKRGRLIRRADVLTLGTISGKLPEDSEPGNASGNASVGFAAELPEASALSSSTETQLAIIRDTLLAPLIAQNERQQATITEQAETIGALRIERDQLQTRMVALEAKTTPAARVMGELATRPAFVPITPVPPADTAALEAERDALQARVRELEQLTSGWLATAPTEPSAAPRRVWWRFWRPS
jgi:excisionase family DNA binding protein